MAYAEEKLWLDGRPSVKDLMADPAVSYALKGVLRDWSRRDPLDAVRDAELLAGALLRQADELLGRASCRR